MAISLDLCTASPMNPLAKDAAFYQRLARSCIVDADFESAKIALLAYINTEPYRDWAYCDLGTIFALQNRLDAARKLFVTALLLNLGNALSLKNLGLIEAGRGCHVLAQRFYEQTLLLTPGLSDTRIKLAKSLLHQGCYERGWLEYEARLDPSCIKTCMHAIPALERWNGSRSIQDTQLTIVSEQGAGDTFQFLRYLPYMATLYRGAEIVFCVRDDMFDIARRSLPGIRVISARHARQLTQGFWLPLLSLPRILQITSAQPRCVQPYLDSDLARFKHWRSLIRHDNKILVGIHWQGEPRHEQTDHQGRSLPLRLFEPIADLDSIVLVSLQKGYGSEQLAGCELEQRFVTCQSQITSSLDWEDTGAIMKSCDFIITNDTSIAHLAGAMGFPTWLLLKKIAEWRWGASGEQTFWYPSMRLFRQRIEGDWEDVMRRVARELTQVVSR